MKKYSIFNIQYSIKNCLICLLLCGCITEYNAPNLEEVNDILVVEGIISDGETIITLSRSINLTEYSSNIFVDYARVFVECDDGSQWEAEDWFSSSRYVRFLIKNDTLKPDLKYRLKIEIEEPDNNSDDCYTNLWGGIVCPTKTYEYYSDYSSPIRTPEIDSIFWMKKWRGQPVTIHVTTQDPKVLYYRWSYSEDWEIRSDVFLEGYRDTCWNSSKSMGLYLGSAERTVVGKLTDKITEIYPWERKLAVMYRITINQNAISKRAYDYFSNIKKNAELTGSIFAPIPSELRGNIVCTTDRNKPVIGYIDVSSTTQNHRFISQNDKVYEAISYNNCTISTKDELAAMSGYIEEQWPLFVIPPHFVVYKEAHPIFGPPDTLYISLYCVDCTTYGTVQKPVDWPKKY